ncbi:MAG TPA: helical backbone metal receptor [Burkholderiaceae bacterium]
MQLIDAIGTAHRPVVPGEELRIVSLVPSITELLCDLGLAPALVGRTGFCIHPADRVAAIAKVGGTKDVNVGKIRALAPTHLVVNIDENEKPTVDQLAAFVPQVVVTHPLGVRDNLALYRLLGGVFGVDTAAEKLCARFEQAYTLAEPPPGAAGPARNAVYCIWREPWMCAAPGTYIADMLALIGVQAWEPAANAKRYPVLEWTADTLAAIDVVLLSTEPYRFTQEDARALGRELNKPVLLVDGEMLSWYGSRAIEGLAYLQHLRKKIFNS